jgi:hypothetical protein
MQSLKPQWRTVQCLSLAALMKLHLNLGCTRHDQQLLGVRRSSLLMPQRICRFTCHGKPRVYCSEAENSSRQVECIRNAYIQPLRDTHSPCADTFAVFSAHSTGYKVHSMAGFLTGTPRQPFNMASLQRHRCAFFRAVPRTSTLGTEPNMYRQSGVSRTLRLVSGKSSCWSRSATISSITF